MKLMGIVNAGPDSFSDARRLNGLDEQIERAMELVAAGADIIDVGAESGVTYTQTTDWEVEAERVVPLVSALAAEGIVVSVDTFKAPVADAALDAGATIVNDVSGLRDPALADLAARHSAALVIMHTRAEPKQRAFPSYDDVAQDVLDLLAARVALARERGVAKVIVDPGPDFAKTPQQTIEALRAIDRLAELGAPWLAAISNKYFIGAITGRPPADRLAGTLAALGWAADHGAAIARVHDVAAARDYLAVRDVLRGAAEVPSFDDEDERLMWIRADR